MFLFRLTWSSSHRLQNQILKLRQSILRHFKLCIITVSYTILMIKILELLQIFIKWCSDVAVIWEKYNYKVFSFHRDFKFLRLQRSYYFWCIKKSVLWRAQAGRNKQKKCSGKSFLHCIEEISKVFITNKFQAYWFQEKRQCVLCHYYWGPFCCHYLVGKAAKTMSRLKKVKSYRTVLLMSENNVGDTELISADGNISVLVSTSIDFIILVNYNCGSMVVLDKMTQIVEPVKNFCENSEDIFPHRSNFWHSRWFKHWLVKQGNSNM